MQQNSLIHDIAFFTLSGEDCDRLVKFSFVAIFGDFALAPTFDSLAVRLALCFAKLAGELVLLASSKSILSELASADLLLGVEVDLRRPGTAAGRDDSSLVISSWVSWYKQ